MEAVGWMVTSGICLISILQPFFSAVSEMNIIGLYCVKLNCDFQDFSLCMDVVKEMCMRNGRKPEMDQYSRNGWAIF